MRISSILCALVLLSVTASAQVPSQINYQGRLVQGTNLVNGVVPLKFRIFTNAVGGTHTFESTNVVTAVDGLYATRIGENTTFGALDAALAPPAIWLEVEADGSILSPRERILSVAYAMRAGNTWQLNGNAGTITGTHFIGATDYLPLDFRINNARGFRLEPATNPANGQFIPNVVGGGGFNVISNGAFGSTIGGGGNSAFPQIAGKNYDTVAGGVGARATGGDSTVVGGRRNEAQGIQSLVGGGFGNVAAAHNSAIASGSNNTIRAGAGFSFIGGGSDNSIGSNAIWSVIAGGAGNSTLNDANFSVIGGGIHNSIAAGAIRSVIAGGEDNDIFETATDSFIGGGSDNNIGAFSTRSVIVGGGFNDIFFGNAESFIGGGAGNEMGLGSHGSVIVGGFDNDIAESAPNAVIPGGRNNDVGANATNALAAGYRAKANHPGAFVWGDLIEEDVTSSADNEVTFRASGGFCIFSNAGMTTGVVLAANSGAWTTISDVNAKEDFREVDAYAILDKVGKLPISTWRYKGQDAAIRHMGPTAQDFATAFGLGDLPGSGITTVDADGVALAAIQGLYQQNAELRLSNDDLRAQNGDLERRIEALEKLMVRQ